MDKKTTSWVAYLTVIGLIIAFCAGDKEGAKFHLNQALVIFLFSLLTPIPCIGQIWAIFMFVCWIMGLIAAINQEEKDVYDELYEKDELKLLKNSFIFRLFKLKISIKKIFLD